MIFYTEHPSPLGTLLLAATTKGLNGLYFEEHKHFKGKDGWQRATQDALLIQACRQLDEYFSKERTTFDLPLDVAGTEFQRKVWQELISIPFGQIVSYTEHARRVNNPAALRAVGAAIGRNPVSIIIPCHRVIGASRAVTGYAGGLVRKHWILAHEGIQLC